MIKKTHKNKFIDNGYSFHKELIKKKISLLFLIHLNYF